VIPSSVAALIVALIPLWMVLLDWLRPGGTRPGPLVFIGVAVGFIGVMFLVRKPETAAGAAYTWGVLALVAATICWAVGSLFNRNARKPSSPLQSVAMQMIAGGGLMLVLGLACGEGRAFSWEAISAVSAWAWIYLTLVGSLIGFTAYVWLLGVSTPARVSTYAFVNPLIAVALGCTIGREPFTSELVLASGLIVVAVALIVGSGMRRRKTAAEILPKDSSATIKPPVPCLGSDTK
jgi:drug/metabolite transporter (DMT)-like permease